MLKDKVGVVIGRFQAGPNALHEGHKMIIKEAMRSSDIVYILVGSSNKPRSLKNPWIFAERKLAIGNWLKLPSVNQEFGTTKVIIKPINDYKYNDQLWINQIVDIVDKDDPFEEVTLFGHMKSDTEYLSWFPFWNTKLIDGDIEIDGTTIRNNLFKMHPELVPESVMEDYKFYQKEKELFKDYPFPETLNFNCSDAVIECNGYIPLVKRKFAPGKGTWALPGGFKNRNENFLDAAIREAKEELNIRVPEKVLRGSIVQQQLFDNPGRSQGIPRNTMVIHFRVQLDADGSLPRISPADDAVECKWFHLSEIKDTPMYDDHSCILKKLNLI